MTGGCWKQKSGWIQIFPASCAPFTFPFLSQSSVCLIVSRVRAYLTTDQHVASELRMRFWTSRSRTDRNTPSRLKIDLGKSGYNGFFCYNGYNGFLLFDRFITDF